MLKRLTIYTYPEHYDNTWSWNDIPLPLKDALLYLFHLPTLSHLTLGPLNDFAIPDLAFHSGLKYLNLRDVRIAPVHPDAREHAWPSIRYMDEVDDLCTSPNANGTLVISLGNHDVQEFQLDIGLSGKTKALFARCSQLMAIRTHKFNYGKGLMLIKGFADTVLPALQTLQHLHIHITVTDGDNHILGGLPAEFDFISGKNVIESISIFVTIEMSRDSGIGHEWSELDRALTKHRSGWPNLKIVTLNVEVNYYYENEEDLRQLPETHLKGLARSEDIKLKFEVTRHDRDSDSSSYCSSVSFDRALNLSDYSD